MTRLFPILLISLFLWQSCGKNESSVRTVAHKYLDYRLQGNFEKAKNLITADSQDLLLELETLSGEFDKADHEPPRYYILNIDQKEGVASVTYELEGYGNEVLTLNNKEGTWKVVLTPQSVPDAGILIRELQGLEEETTPDVNKETLDNLLLEEEEEKEWDETEEN